MTQPLPPGLEMTPHGPLVLLFYDGYDLKARPGAIGGLKSALRFHLRKLKRTLCRQQAHTGFYTAFLSLRHCLEQAGCHVRVNDFAAARKRPHYPIGIAGYPSVLNRIDLPNPRIFGPGDFGTPPESQSLAQDARYRRLIQPSEWFASIYRPFCGEKLRVWFAGLDTQAWPDTSQQPKDLDFLVYDKIYWQRDTLEEQVLGRILRHLDARGLSYKTLRYGHHHQSEYRAALKRARALLFISHTETQGLAYQEAMASGLPVLAWDEGIMHDPTLKRYLTPQTHPTSIPYFDETCGMRFQIEHFEMVCDAFIAKRGNFQPRRYIASQLSSPKAAERYIMEYIAILEKTNS